MNQPGKNEKPLDDYIGFLRSLQSIAQRTINKFSNRDNLSNTSLLSLFLVEKTMCAAASARQLLPHYIRSKEYEYGLGLIMRTSLYDTLIALNLSQLYENGDINQLEDFSFDLLIDGMKFLLKVLEDENTKNRKDVYHVLVKTYGFAFEKYEFNGGRPKLLKPKTEKVSSALNLFQSLKGDCEEMKMFKSFYNKYLFYSKYGHVQALYHSVSRQPDGTKDWRLRESFKAMFLLVDISIILLHHLNIETVDLTLLSEEMQQLTANLL